MELLSLLKPKTIEALDKYGYYWCKKAFSLYEDGMGGYGIADHFNTEKKDADIMIEAGRDLHENNIKLYEVSLGSGAVWVSFDYKEVYARNECEALEIGIAEMQAHVDGIKAILKRTEFEGSIDGFDKDEVFAKEAKF